MERPHSALGYMSPQQYRDAAAPLGGEFLARFFRSGAARGATCSALTPFGPLRLRYKIAPKMD